MRRAIWLGLVFGIGIGSAAGPVRADWIYDPSLGTLPEAQGFIPQVTPNDPAETGTPPGPVTFPPAPTVSGGRLHQDTTADRFWHQWWIQPLAPPAFQFSGGFEIFAQIEVFSAPLATTGSGLPRGGYEVAGFDDDGHFLSFTLTDNQVWIDTSGNGIPGFTSFATFNTHGMHTYQLRSFGSLAELYIDGVLQASIGLPAGTPTPPSVVAFGEHTGATGGRIDVAFIQFHAVPEPSTWLLCLGALAGVAAVGRVRRKQAS